MDELLHKKCVRATAASLLIVVHGLLVGWMSWKTSLNLTEAGHLGAAVFFWRTFRFDVFRVNPPLTRIVSGAPLAFTLPDLDLKCHSQDPRDRSEWEIGSALVAASSRDAIRVSVFLARSLLIPLLLLGGYAGYGLARGIYGNAAGIVFLLLWCFCPFLLSCGATICPDAVASALGVVGVYTFHQWLREPNWMRTFVAGISLGLLLLSKLTWIIACGIWPLLWYAWICPSYSKAARRSPLPYPSFLQLSTILFLGLYTLNMGYLFDGTFRPLGKYSFVSQALQGQQGAEDQEVPSTGNRFAGTWLGGMPVPLPADYVQGMDVQRYDFERGLPSYLRGIWADHGWWYYYLYVLVVKMPLGTWCLGFLAIACAFFHKGYAAAWRDEIGVLLPGLILFALVSSQTGISMHPRYIIPSLPFLYIGISRVGRAFTLKRPMTASLTALSIVYMIVSGIAVFPHSMSYFNELAAVLPTRVDASYPKPINTNGERRSILAMAEWALTIGPRNGARHLLDSNIDWGQDVFFLEDWYGSHREARPIKVALRCVYPPRRSTVKSVGYPPIGPGSGRTDLEKDSAATGPMAGWYALSVSQIYARTRHYRYFLHFNPVATAGYSIYIYRINVNEANRVRRELGLPDLPIDERRSKEIAHIE